MASNMSSVGDILVMYWNREYRIGARLIITPWLDNDILFPYMVTK